MIVLARPKMDKMSALVFHDNIIASPARDFLIASERVRQPLSSHNKKVIMANNIRIEEDLLGMREVPADAYYGVHTLRAIENFYISNSKISDIPEFVRGIVIVF